jgi:hypothetical protein
LGASYPAYRRLLGTFALVAVAGGAAVARADEAGISF